MIVGCFVGLMVAVMIKGIQHTQKVIKESEKLHEQNMKTFVQNNQQLI